MALDQTDRYHADIPAEDDPIEWTPGFVAGWALLAGGPMLALAAIGWLAYRAF